MNLSLVEAWLVTHAGLAADKLGPGQVARSARERICATGSADARAYVELLTTSLAEQLCFIESIVVTETWFFRERAALDGLMRHVTGGWAARHAASPFRVLSVPCSTGEEPYSIAMALALAAWPVARLQIDAVDISRDSIMRGAEGTYRKNSFRGADLAFREIFFNPIETDAWSLRAAVRAPVRFQEANLFGDAFAIGRPLYDAIFCRNLLIYFDPPVQTKAFNTLSRLLADDGLLAVGPAEAALALEHGFSPVPGASMFLFQKAVAKPALARPPSPRVRARGTSAISMPVAKPASAVRPASPLRAPEPAVLPLQKLRALADTGRLSEAKEFGEALLRSDGASAALCYLLAVVCDAAGDQRRAEEFYRKTLYLDPGHAESLAHLALLLEQHGDPRAAAAFRARARRGAGVVAARAGAKEVA